jgi:acyl-CoA hydrolase
MYNDKLMTPEEAVQIIKSNDNIFIGAGAVVPKTLIHAMVKRYKELRNVKIHHILTLGTTEETAPYMLPEMQDSFTHYALFTGSNTRKGINEGRGYFMPIFLSEVAQYLRNLKPDIALIQISPPDSRGYCSIGTSVDVTRTGFRQSKIVIAEINPKVPRTQGYSFIHLNEIDRIIEVDHPLPEIPEPSFTDVHNRIGKNISNLIPDGACLQVGIGNIPDATLQFLGNHQNLGVHSELISDGIMKLAEKGVITGLKKSLNTGKIVTGIIMGSQKLYNWCHENPTIEMRPSEYTNDIFNISRNDNVVAINTALSVDLKGQVCADSLGKKIYSGIGGQVDFIRGAARSKGGKPIIALPSTVMKRDGRVISRIAPMLDSGAGVVTSEGDVHYVVTEFGVADLHHKGVGERAKQLINIAHPDFREELSKWAYEANFKI